MNNNLYELNYMEEIIHKYLYDKCLLSFLSKQDNVLFDTHY